MFQFKFFSSKNSVFYVCLLCDFTNTYNLVNSWSVHPLEGSAQCLVLQLGFGHPRYFRLGTKLTIATHLINIFVYYFNNYYLFLNILRIQFFYNRIIRIMTGIS